MKPPYDVRLQWADDGGVVVSVGCKTLVYSHGEIDNLLADLREYINHPEEAVSAACKRHGWYVPTGEPLTVGGIRTLGGEGPRAEPAGGYNRAEPCRDAPGGS